MRSLTVPRNFTVYEEWRTNEDNVKLYHQLRTVDYADYRVGFWYISPFALRDKGGGPLIKVLEKKKQPVDLFEHS